MAAHFKWSIKINIFSAETCDGYAAYLRKPAEPEEVLKTIRRLTPAPARQPRYRGNPDVLARPHVVLDAAHV